MLKYFLSSLIFTAIGLLLAVLLGLSHQQSGRVLAMTVFTTMILAVLEISLSFDNAIVNALILKNMSKVWRKRFLTWGLLIAVFGVRLILPLLIVSFFATVNPWQALMMAAQQPQQYAQLMLSSRLQVAAFGGSFLLLVTSHYFFSQEHRVLWIHSIEAPLRRWGKRSWIAFLPALLILAILTIFLPAAEKSSFLYASSGGVVTYAAVEALTRWLKVSGKTLHTASAGMFFYLEVLDASFSFDGVVGGFAITQDLFIIMIGLSIGAFFVRSLTLMFVEEGTLTEFTYLEQGAFYAIGALALLMLAEPFVTVPEWCTGTIGALIIGLSFRSSLQARKESAGPKQLK